MSADNTIKNTNSKSLDVAMLTRAAEQKRSQDGNAVGQQTAKAVESAHAGGKAQASAEVGPSGDAKMQSFLSNATKGAEQANKDWKEFSKSQGGAKPEDKKHQDEAQDRAKEVSMRDIMMRMQIQSGVIKS